MNNNSVTPIPAEFTASDYKKVNYARISAIVCFATLLTCLLINVIFDLTIFSSFTKQFLGALIISIIVFIIGLAAFIVSFVLIFGFFIVGQHGFWPISWAANTFKEIIGDFEIDGATKSLFMTTRVIMFVILILILIFAIISLSISKKYRKLRIDKKLGRGFAIPTLILAILGIFAQIAALAIFGSL